jgi:hypothetical protein
MEHRSRTCINIWSRSLRHGRRRFQSKVVCCIPSHCFKHLQRICQQLVEYTLRTSYTGFPQVCIFNNRLILKVTI